MRAGGVTARHAGVRAAVGVAPRTGRTTGRGVPASRFTFRGRPAEDRGLIAALVGPAVGGRLGVAAGAHVEHIFGRPLLAVLVGPLGVAFNARFSVGGCGSPAAARDIGLGVGLGPLVVAGTRAAVLAGRSGAVRGAAARVRFGRGRLIRRGVPGGQRLRGRKHRNQETESSNGCQQMFLHGKPLSDTGIHSPVGGTCLLSAPKVPPVDGGVREANLPELA